MYQDGDYLQLIDHYNHTITDYDDTAFGAGTLTCTFLESRSMTVENLPIHLFILTAI